MQIYEADRVCIADAALPEQVVLVPCSAGSARQYDTLVEQLAGYVTAPVELCGHGDRQSWHGAGPLWLSQEATAIAMACPWAAPFHLIGHSYGGAVALRFALSFPERLLSLTLIEPSCFHVLRSAEGADPALLDEIRALADDVNHGVICGDYHAAMEPFIDYWCGPGSWRALPEAKKNRFARLAIQVAHHFWSLIEEATPLRDYAVVDAPTLILCGANSPRPSRAITRMLAETLPRARHRTIRDAGHMSPLTHPGEVNPLILEHLRASGGRPGPTGNASAKQLKM